MAALIAFGQFLIALCWLGLRLVGALGLWLLVTALKQPLKSVAALLMIVVLLMICCGGPNNSHTVDRVSRLIVPIALLLVVLGAGGRFLKPPKF